jgi:DNA-binding response OmpR family regulator
MLTAKTAEESILEGLNIGADDYVVKPFSPRQLMARVEAILRRVTLEAIPLSSEMVFHDGDLVIDGTRHEVRKNGSPIALTATEFNILLTLAKYPTKTFTREELIALAYSDTYEGFDRVIDTHIKNIRQKIDGKYIKTVHGVGYAFTGE